MHKNTKINPKENKKYQYVDYDLKKKVLKKQTLTKETLNHAVLRELR